MVSGVRRNLQQQKWNAEIPTNIEPWWAHLSKLETMESMQFRVYMCVSEKDRKVTMFGIHCTSEQAQELYVHFCEVDKI